MKKRTKITLSICLSFCLLLIFHPIVARASDNSPEIMPVYTGVKRITADITISSSGYANLNTQVSVRSGYSADVTLQLCYDSDEIEYTWTTSGSGMLTLNKGRYVVPGHEYYARAHVIVYDSHDNIVDDITFKSNVVSC